MSLTKVTFPMIEGAPSWAAESDQVAEVVNQLTYSTPGSAVVSDAAFYGPVYSPMPIVNIHAKNYTIGEVTADTEQSAVNYWRIKYTGDRFVDVNNVTVENYGPGETGMYTGVNIGHGTGNIIGLTQYCEIKSATIPYAYAADCGVRHDFPATTRSVVYNGVTQGSYGAYAVYYSANPGGAAAPSYHFKADGTAASVADFSAPGNCVLEGTVVGKASVATVKTISLPVGAWQPRGATQVNVDEFTGWQLANASTDSICTNLQNYGYASVNRLEFYFTRLGTEATGNVVFQILGSVITDGFAIGTYVLNTSITVSVPNQNIVKYQLENIDVTVPAGALVQLCIKRLGSDGADTFTGNIVVLGANFFAK